MDIKHLEYFIEIVHSENNLSVASKKLCVSQPTLSLLIKNFETNENVTLFERHKGKLQRLTLVGERFYENAKQLVENHREMMDVLREDSVKIKGRIKIGIPPFVLGMVFADILSRFLGENPDIEFEIIEAGSNDLQRKLLLKELDFAILLQPTNTSPDIVDEYLLQVDELTAFMREDNPLANQPKISWQALDDKPLAIFSDSFAIHHQLLNQFKKERIEPKIAVTSSSWDFLLQVTRYSDFITILPSPVAKNFSIPHIAEIPFERPVAWKVALCSLKKDRYSHVEKYVLNRILLHFKESNLHFAEKSS